MRRHRVGSRETVKTRHRDTVVSHVAMAKGNTDAVTREYTMCVVHARRERDREGWRRRERGETDPGRPRRRRRNLHKRLHGIAFKKRAPRAVKEIKAFAKKAMQVRKKTKRGGNGEEEPRKRSNETNHRTTNERTNERTKPSR